jgi:hypothetical protein
VTSLSDAQIVRAAVELASQERYNPAWCKPGVGASDNGDGELYRRRARLILEAALRP